MECTQRLECTQDLYETHSQRTCPEEIGFLGICGKKYSVKKGPNKIGRDPQACNIELNLNSISRQHAVINVINSTNFMIMDLDSANKTKLGGKTLQPYIPHPLRDGDTLQFGDVFGIFRLLEKGDELPMTQALDIPDTPMTNHHISRMNRVPITLVPESPDCSDMEDSYVVPSQDGDKSDTNSHFIKPGKTIAIQPIGSKKIDNIYWNGSKKSKSLSLSLNSSKVSLNTSDPTIINRLSCDDVSIHEMETQDSKICKIESLCSKNEAAEEIMKENQSIYSQPTQIHPKMPDVQKVSMQHELQINLYASNKENIDNLHEAETQLYQMEAPKISGTPTKRISEGAKNASNDKIEERHLSDEEIVFDEVDSQSFYERFESQSIIPEDIIPNIEDNPVVETNKIEEEKNQEEKPANKRVSRVKSGDSTDCEDIEMALTQIVSERPKVSDDDLTDCEDVDNDLIEKTADKNKDTLLHIEDLQTQVIEIDAPIKKGEHLNPPIEENFEDLPTQILVEDTIEKPEVVEKPVEDISFEDLPTQTITIESQMKQACRQSTDQDYSEEIVGPFKRPLLVAMKNKRKEVPMIQKEVVVVEDDNFYQSTQAIFEDLCSQEPYIARNNGENKTDELEKPLNSVINKVIGCNLPHNEKSQNVNKKKSSTDNGDIKNYKHVSTSSKQKELPVDKVRRTPSDSSDVDSTPRKGKALKFSDNDLPNSQEIKKSVNMNQKCVIDVNSSDSETENNSLDDRKTPLLYHKKKKSKIDAKLDLTKRFEPDALPTRVITRVRKPTEYASERSASILKPKFIPEQEDGIDKEIITENISRLKAKSEKSKTKSENSKSDNRETKTLEKSKEGEKSSAKHSRAETSKTRNSKEDKKSAPKTNGIDSSKTLKKSDTGVDSKISTRRTRSQNKDNNTTVNNQSSETAKPKDKIKPHEAGQSNVNLNSTEGANQSSRTTRSKKGQTKSLSPETKPKRSYRSRTKKTPDKEIDQSKDTVRRTRRGKNAEVKENNPETIKPKSILKPSSYDQSVVYNKSSESMGSPSGVKRSANNDMMVPSPKRTRATTEPIGSMRPSKIHHVLFTGLAAPEIEAKLNKLGAVTVNDVGQCTVVLTSEIRRTFKLLCAVGLGRPVVGSAWVQACVDTHTIVDPWKYLIKDEKVEKRFRFDLRRTLLGKRNYLKGFTVSTTPSVMPPEQEMKQIVKCSGGIWGEGGPRWMVLSTPRDATMWPGLMRRGARIVSTEFVLEGVLRQIPDVDSYLLR